MATLSGLRLLHKNMAMTAAMRVCSRSRGVPKRILNYSRFATQLNFLRWNDRTLNNLVSDCLDSSNMDMDDKYPISNSLKEPHRKPAASNRDEPERDEQSFHGSNLISEPIKLFRSKQEYNENNYIYRHIHKRLDHFAKLGQELHSLPVEPSIKMLQDLVKQKRSLPNDEFYASLKNLLAEIKNHVKYMNQQELAILLTAIKDYDQTEFRLVKRIIDIELRWLLKKHVGTYLMDIDLWFYLADTFYECLVKSVFVNVLVNFLATEKEINLSNAQFLHLLFLVILQRDSRGIISNYENRISQILDQASFEDVATVSMAYFKTRAYIRNSDIKRKIIERTIENLPSIDASQPGYCSIIKSLRYSRDVESRDDILRLSSALLEDKNRHIIETSPYNAVHTVKLLESRRIYNPKLLDYLSTTMFNRLADFRIKDIQYALTSLSNFAYKNLTIDTNLKENFDVLCQDIVKETRSDSDHNYFHIFPLLRAFCIFGYYNDELIDYVNNLLKDHDKLDQMKYVLEFERSALLVYIATRIEGHRRLEHPDLFRILSAGIGREGNLGSVRQDSSIKHLDFILRSTSMSKNLSISKAFCQFAKELSSTKELQDESYNFNFQYTLPHQNFADLIVSRGFKEPGHFDSVTLAPRKVPEDQNHCLIIATRNTDYVDGYKRLSGYRQFVTRLLTKIGYTVMHVNLDEPDLETTARKIRSRLGSGSKSCSNESGCP